MAHIWLEFWEDAGADPEGFVGGRGVEMVLFPNEKGIQKTNSLEMAFL